MSARAAARTLVALALAFGLLVVGPSTALRWLHDESLAPWQRWVAVLLGVVSVLPILGVCAFLMHRSDEYQQRGLYQSMAIGLGLSVVVLCAIDFLQVAGFLPWGAAPMGWQLVLLCWGAGVLVVRALRMRGG